MTLQQFDQTAWTFGMKAQYDGEIYPIITVDFGERLIGLKGFIQNEPTEIIMVRCENVKLIL